MNRISIRQAATQFGVSRRTLERWVRDGRLTAIPDAQDGRQRLVDPEAIQVLIKQMPKRREKSTAIGSREALGFVNNDPPETEREPIERRYSQAIDRALRQVYGMHCLLLSRLTNDAVQELTLQELREGPLGRDLRHLAAYAQGHVYEDGRHVLAAIDSVLQVLFWPTAVEDYTVPRSFWDTDLGRMLSHAQLRAYKPTDLVSIDDAARMLGVTTPTIYRWIDDRTLGWVRDDMNGRSWVVRRDIEQLKRLAAGLSARQRTLERALAS